MRDALGCNCHYSASGLALLQANRGATKYGLRVVGQAFSAISPWFAFYITGQDGISLADQQASPTS